MYTKPMGAALVTVAAVLVLALGLAGPASAIDADRRFGEPPSGERPGALIAPAKPDIHCLRVRTVPVHAGSALLYVPCSDDLLEPTPKRWDDERPPLMIPLERLR
jgi:hypothetical protein